MEEALSDQIIKSSSSMFNTHVVFKYLDFDSGLKTLQNQNIIFSRPDRFNDPFDCRVELLEVDLNMTRKHMAGAFARMLKNDYTKRFRLKRQLDKASDQQLEDLTRRSLSAEFAQRGVTCFSTSFEEVLMWAHYCKNHTGICIGFDLVKLYSFLRNYGHEIGYFPVDYVDSINKKSLYPVNAEAIMYMLKTKSDIWKYEKEVRIIGSKFTFDEKLMSFIKLPKEIFTHVYIGINVTPNKRDEVLSLAKEINPNISVFKMIPDYTLLKLISTEI
ncbi:DUF2971 domain-containing protein [Pedobacter gandavensis]|uniref:DUF2971 domain-containing protein n=1 Tax=Pedobacter gandavensis TaxID=2679963 RepID=UPI00247B1DB3|nr:DUF2971 domain-containing protein [Pedobacter gandavensis]WGQ10728.1 DUF2971 domain-containing protein [Pedobacter gandavensis]